MTSEQRERLEALVYPDGDVHPRSVVADVAALLAAHDALQAQFAEARAELRARESGWQEAIEQRARAERLQLALDEISELCGPGGDDTPFGRVESALSVWHEKRKQAERELAEARAEVERLDRRCGELADAYVTVARERNVASKAAAHWQAEHGRCEKAKDGAYEERNRLVAALAAVFPSYRTRTAIEGWSEDWHGCIYVDLPTGQCSWHFHDSQAHLFTHVPERPCQWDGHTTEEKYRRVAAFASSSPAPTGDGPQTPASGEGEGR